MLFMSSKRFAAAFFKLFSRTTVTWIIATHLWLAADKGLDGLVVVVPVVAARSMDMALMALIVVVGR